jgi:hypothetical protein
MLIAAGVAGTVPAASCARAPHDPARALVEDMAEAAEDRDVNRVMERVSEAFRGPEGLTRAAAGASLRRYFAGYETIDIEVFDVASEPAGDVTQVRARVGFRGEANRALGLEGLLPPSAVYRFDLEVAEEGGTWRVTRASWERATPPAEPAAP